MLLSIAADRLFSTRGSAFEKSPAFVEQRAPLIGGTTESGGKAPKRTAEHCTA
jgi:hypothetical protein